MHLNRYSVYLLSDNWVAVHLPRDTLPPIFTSLDLNKKCDSILEGNYLDGDNKMEFRDLKTQYKKLKPQIDKEIAEVIGETSFISGKKIKELEEKLAEFVGVKHCITCASGTDALLIPLMGWNIKKGEAVFVPDFTFFATAEAPARLGATPVFVDIKKETFNMDPDSLEKEINRVEKEGKLKPRAIIAVDLFGRPANYDKIEKIAKEHNLILLEDGAQGFAGSLHGKMACSFGDAAATSFFPAKPLGCYGDGGAVFTNDDKLYDYMRSAAVHGKGADKYDNVRIGLNSRLDTIQAAILMPKFEALKEYELKDINTAAQKYSERLQSFAEVPKIAEGYCSSWAQYSILLKNSKERSKVMEALKAAGIPSNIYYRKPLHSQTAFAYLTQTDAELPVTTDVCRRVLSLPLHPYMTDEMIDTITKTIKSALN